MVLDHENIARVHLRMKARAAGRADGAEKIRQPALKGIRAQRDIVCRWGAAAREDRHFAREEEGVEQETTYVKLNIGAPMS